MPSEFHNLEESLKKFLLDALSDSYNIKNANMPKYNNLRLFVLPSKNRKPHFCLRIGISEAMFDLESTEKISGGLGSDERLVRRWMDKIFVLSDLRAAWERQKKVEMSPNEQD